MKHKLHLTAYNEKLFRTVFNNEDSSYATVYELRSIFRNKDLSYMVISINPKQLPFFLSLIKELILFIDSTGDFVFKEQTECFLFQKELIKNEDGHFFHQGKILIKKMAGNNLTLFLNIEINKEKEESEKTISMFLQMIRFIFCGQTFTRKEKISLFRQFGVSAKQDNFLKRVFSFIK